MVVSTDRIEHATVCSFGVRLRFPLSLCSGGDREKRDTSASECGHGVWDSSLRVPETKNVTRKWRFPATLTSRQKPERP